MYLEKENKQNVQLSDLEYSVLMQAIENARDEHICGNFVNPYDQYDNQTSDDDITMALQQAEKKIMLAYLTDKV